MTALIGSIATTSQEQSTGIQNVTLGMEQLDRVTGQSAANSEELASTAEETSAQATCLKQMVARFQTQD